MLTFFHPWASLAHVRNLAMKLAATNFRHGAAEFEDLETI